MLDIEFLGRNLVGVFDTLKETTMIFLFENCCSRTEKVKEKGVKGGGVEKG